MSMIFDTAINVSMINTSDNVWNNSKNMKNDIKISHKTPMSNCICMMLKTIKSTVLCTISSYDNTAIIQ